MRISEVSRKLRDKTLEVGFRLNVDSFQCSESAFGEVTFEWINPDGGNTNYKIAMKTNLHIPEIKKHLMNEYEWVTNWSGCLGYKETKRDDVTGREVSRTFKVKFKAVFEYQNDHNLHVVQFVRIPEKSETDKRWVFEFYNEGMMYLTGEGFPKDRNKAIEMFRRAADQNHAGAKMKLQELGESVVSKLNNNKMTFDNGDIYEGDIVNGLCHGKGKWTFAEGGFYEGDFVNGNFHGKGKWTFAEGGFYEGDFANSNMYGKGKWVFPDNVIYEGDFVGGEMHGKGKMTFANKSFYEGDFVNNRQTGKGKFIWPDGKSYTGDFVDDKFHGKGIKTYPDGRVEDGSWKDDEFLG